MTWMADILENLRHDEGKRLESYLEPNGDISVGYGHNITRRGITISADLAESLLYADVLLTIHDLDQYWPFWRQLDEVRRAAVVNATYNLGIRGWLGFKKAIAALEAGDYGRAADEMLDSKWASQVGSRAVRLTEVIRG